MLINIFVAEADVKHEKIVKEKNAIIALKAGKLRVLLYN